MKCNKPQRAPKGAKQKYIVKACDDGEQKNSKVLVIEVCKTSCNIKILNVEQVLKLVTNVQRRKIKLTPGWWACNYNW